VHRSPLLRAIAIFLLAWIAVDLVAIDTCVLDVDEVAGCPGSTVAFRAPGSSHHGINLNPDHCLCHGHTIAPGTPAALAAPVLIETSLAAAVAARPHDSSSALYHPPQLLA
jgi:hypothetical protein